MREDQTDGATQPVSTASAATAPTSQDGTETLSEAERLYRVTPAMLHSIDAKGRLLCVSDRWLSTLGYERHEVIGRPSTDFLTEDSRRRSELLLARFFETGAVENAEYQMVTRSGDTLDVLLSAVLERDSAGCPIRSLAVITDVTERKQQEAIQRRGEQSLKRTGEVAGVGAWELDLADQTLYWSEQTRRIHGVDDDYVPTLECAIEFFAPEARHRIRNAIRNAIDHGTAYDLELPFVRHAGERLWVRAVGQAECKHDQPIRLHGAIQDVTDRVEQRRALESAHERLTVATDSGRIGVWEYELRSGRLDWDICCCRLYGLDETHGHDESGGCDRWLSLVHESDRATVNTAVHNAIAGLADLDLTHRIRRPDGGIRHVRTTARVKRDAYGRALRLIGANWDVTPLAELSAELDRERRMLQVTLQSIGYVFEADAICSNSSDPRDPHGCRRRAAWRWER